jgi:hypothetical protein
MTSFIFSCSETQLAIIMFKKAAAQEAACCKDGLTTRRKLIKASHSLLNRSSFSYAIGFPGGYHIKDPAASSAFKKPLLLLLLFCVVLSSKSPN